MTRDEAVQQLITLALFEDLHERGDITSQAIFSEDDRAEAIIKGKEEGVLSGVSLLVPLFATLDARVEVTLHAQDGQKLLPGDLICTLRGPIIALLSGERLALNLLQHLSGVATATNSLVSHIAHTQAQLIDTRKTTPLLRFLEKEAVVHGGGANHRMGLYDMIMAKDTHVFAAGGPDKAVERAQAWRASHEPVAIEVEVESLEDFAKALVSRPERIMLDNMAPELLRLAVELRNAQAPSIELEASGNVTQDTIVAIAESGVDFISVGAITHSVKALDIHLKIVG